MRTKSITRFLLVLAAVFALTRMPAAYAQGDDCADFETQEEAQAFFEDHGGPDADDFGLDLDENGIACDFLPSSTTVDESPTPSPSPTPTATPEPSASPRPTAVPTPTPRTVFVPVVQRRGLPITGKQVAVYGGSGSLLLAVGLTFVAVNRRRRRLAMQSDDAPWGDDPLIGW